MNDFAPLVQPDKGQPAHDIHLVDQESYEDWLTAQPADRRALLAAQRFEGKGYQFAILPGTGEDEWAVVAGVADVDSLSSWCLAKLGEELPEGAYRLAGGGDPGPALFGWMSGQYRFGRYLDDKSERGPRVLLTPKPAAIAAKLAEVEAVALVRDLINTPTEHMGPEELEAAADALAKECGAELEVIRGDRLESEYPMVHAVGRAASRRNAPRLIRLEWGKAEHPAIAIIGKGVMFDSGGLDIKPASGMRLMKKDMGGAAHALALTGLVMKTGLPVRVHLLLPSVENAISGDALRPGDVIESRKGITVEIDNTDAEGRLVLADAIARADEEEPELIVDFATLTGAARVALGPDLPALFSTDDALAEALLSDGEANDDPLWRLPLHDAYDEMLKSDIADTQNAGGGFAGAITAALFLKKFVSEGRSWAHFDTYAWRQAAKPGRPKGGEALGLRAAWAMLQDRYSG